MRAYAKEMGLDPDRTAHDYFAQFAPLSAPTPPTPVGATSSPETRTIFIPNWLALGALAAVVVTLGTLTLRRAERVSRSPSATAPVVGTTGRSADATVASETRDKAPARDITLPAATPPTPQHALVVQLTPTRRCWVTASADGKRVIYRLLLPGTTETLTADREIQIMAGDAGALEWTINGRKAGLFGKSGQIVTQRLTPESAAAIK